MSCIRTAVQEEVGRKTKQRSWQQPSWHPSSCQTFTPECSIWLSLRLLCDKMGCDTQLGERRSHIQQRKGRGTLQSYSSAQSLSRVGLFVTPRTAERQASQSITNSQSPPKPMSIESVMPSNHLIFCRPLLLLPSIFPSIRVFSNESALRIRWPKYWSFSFNISPFNEHPGLISFRIDWLDLLAVQGTLKSLL